MKPSNLCRVSIISAAEPAVKKLKRQNIAVYDCKKRGAEFIFCVKDKDIRKVFAIFAKPCYNVRIDKKSLFSRLAGLALLRLGLIAGGALYLAAAVICNLFIFRVEVTGSGSYLKNEVCAIISREGGGAGKPYSKLNAPLATGSILALPQVVFCNLQKRGSVLVVDVEVDGSQPDIASYSPLVSDMGGKIRRIVAICGTAAVEEGAEVGAGDVLIYPYVLSGEVKTDCLCVGFAEICAKKSATYLAEDDSSQSLRLALASAVEEGDKILSQTHRVEYPEGGGALFIIETEYLHTISLNVT